MPTPESRTITDAKLLAVLANPARVRLIDILRIEGPSTASLLAERSGQAIGSVSHHMKMLARIGFVEEVPELAKDKRERWWRLVVSSWRWNRTDVADDPASEAVAVAAESLGLTRQTDLARGWLDADDGTSPWSGAAFVNQSWLKLTPEELVELSAQVVELFHAWRDRDLPEDGKQRENVFVYARGFPTQP